MIYDTTCLRPVETLFTIIIEAAQQASGSVHLLGSSNLESIGKCFVAHRPHLTFRVSAFRSVQAQLFREPVGPGEKVECQSLDQTARHRPLELRILRRRDDRHSLPIIPALLRHLNHARRQIGIACKRMHLLRAHSVAVLLVLDQSAWLDENRLEPFLMHLEVIFRVHQIGIDIREGSRQQPVYKSRVLLVEKRIHTRGAQPHNRRHFRAGLGHPEIHQGHDDTLSGILCDVRARHIVIARNGGEDSVGIFEAGGDEAGVGKVPGEDPHIGKIGSRGDLLEELGF